MAARGQILARPGGKFLVRWYLKEKAGKKKYKSKTVPGPKRDAQKFLTKQLAARDAGNLVASTRQTVDAWLDEWLELWTSRVSSRTREWKRWVLARYVRPTLGSTRLDKLEVEHVQKLFNQMKDQGYSSRTRRMASDVLSQALKKAVDLRRLAANPAAASQLDLPKRKKKRTARPPSLTSDEARALLQAASERVTLAKAAILAAPGGRKRHEAIEEAANRAQFALFLDLMLNRGLRIGEGLGLTWSDLDLKAGELHVRRALTFDVKTDEQGKRRRVPVTRDPKTTRAVPLPLIPRLVKALEAHRDAQQKRAERYAGSYWLDSDGRPEYVFANELGRPLDYANLRQRYLGPTIAQAKLHWVRPGALRHTTATLLVDAGVPVPVVSELLGHTHTSTTLDNYVFPVAGRQREATAILEGALQGG